MVERAENVRNAFAMQSNVSGGALNSCKVVFFLFAAVGMRPIKVPLSTTFAWRASLAASGTIMLLALEVVQKKALVVSGYKAPQGYAA